MSPLVPSSTPNLRAPLDCLVSIELKANIHMQVNTYNILFLDLGYYLGYLVYIS